MYNMTEALRVENAELEIEIAQVSSEVEVFRESVKTEALNHQRLKLRMEVEEVKSEIADLVKYTSSPFYFFLAIN
jgi:hypothetical protein